VIVNVETAEGNREFIVPSQWHGAVLSLLETIDRWVMSGVGEMVQPRLIDRGVRSIAVIKVLRTYYEITLMEGKRYVDRAPITLPPLPHIKAQKMLIELESVGAKAELPSAVDRLGALAKHDADAARAMSALNGE